MIPVVAFFPAQQAVPSGGKRGRLGVLAPAILAQIEPRESTMTVFSRLARQAPSSPKNLAERIAELDSHPQESIAEISLGSDDEGLRIAAIAKLGYGDALSKLATQRATSESAAIQRAAQQRVAQLIDVGALEFAAFCNHIADHEMQLSIAALCADAAHLQQAVAAIRDSKLLCKLAVESLSSKVRQLAADAIHDPAELRQVLKDARSKDKNVYKIIKGKCDELLAQEKAAAELQAGIQSLCAALERHIHQPFDNLFVPTLDHLDSQWKNVATHAPAEIQARAEQAIARCRDIVGKHVQQAAQQAARAAAVASADADRQSVIAELRDALAALYAEPNAIDIPMAKWSERWEQLARYKSPSAEAKAQFAKLRTALGDTTQLVAQHGTVQQQAESFRNASADTDLSVQSQALGRTLAATTLLDDNVPTPATEAAALLHAWEQARADRQVAAANSLRQLGSLIHKASGALGAGKTGPAAGLRRAIEEKLRSIAVVPTHLANQLQQLDAKLHLLQDWKSYAVAPKRIELIEQMEALIGAEQSPKALAEQIKRLQDEWKTISKGSVDDADAEWQRFHQAAQTAYQPCREFFAAQAKQRHDNLDKRKALLARITQFEHTHNWEQPDWREVARAVREAPQQWRNHQPVERAANKPVQDSFDAVLAKLRTRLAAEYANNVAERQSLIARAQRLLDEPDSRKATDDVKRLQLAWKNAGVVAREDDQKLWAEFRQHCDAVFGKREQQHSAHVTELEANKSKAVDLCHEAEQLLALSGPETIEGVKKLPSLRAAFDAVGELPKANARELQNRFDRAVAQFDKNLARQRALDKAQAWDRLLEVGDKIRRYRLAIATHAPGDESDTLKQAVQSFIDGVQHWPKGGLQAAKAELVKTASTDTTANETLLRTLCIRAEILTDSPTPASDQAFKRNYQVRHLMQGMGQARQSNRDELESMVFEWIAVGATDNAVYAELLARFNACRAKVAGNT